MTTTRDVFLSHSSGDVDVARELRVAIEAAGWTCWMAPDDVVGSDPWAEQILAAIDGSRAMIVLISTHANQSQHVSREVNLALGRKRAVLPIRIENVTPEASLEYLLSLVQRIDAFPPPISGHVDRILKRLNGLIPVPAVAAAPASAADASTTVSTAPPASPPEAPTNRGIGSRVAGFTIEGILGEGGMATVYSARQDEPRRSVALKVIRADHAADPVYRERFLTEKDTLASLEHPAIVPIYAAGEADGVLYIAMRLIDGSDLAERLRDHGPLSLEETIETLQPIADAVDYAHDKGVVHRDLKPSNIVLDKSGRPYLTDFGLGKHIDRSQGLSAPGVAIGTLDYMAPEQFSGLVDAALAGRIDVYALGCVAYACLTGMPPFRGDSPERVMYAHLHESMKPVRSIRPDLPVGVDVALARALAKNPADRFESGRALLSALRPARERETERTVAVPLAAGAGSRGISRLIRANPAVTAAVAIVAILALAGTGMLALNLTGAATPSASLPGIAESSGSPSAAPLPSSAPSFLATLAPSFGPSPAPPASISPSLPPTAAPIQDTAGPAGGTLSLSGSFNSGTSTTITTSTSVTVRITKGPTDKSGVCSRAITDSSSKPGSSAWTNYGGGTASVGHKLASSSYGSHKVYVWFRDCSSNHNVTSRTLSIKFDHSPAVTNGLQFDWTAANLSGQTSFYIDLIKSTATNHIATDPEGYATIGISKVWQILSNGTTVDKSTGLNATGTRLTFSPIDSTYCNMGDTTFKFGFTVTDLDGASKTGNFFLRVCN